MKLKKLFAVAALAVIGGSSSFAKEDVTSKLNDAALANESNWALVSNGGNHTPAQNGYHESWHNTFSLTQTVSGLDAGYYRVSIQVANSIVSTNVSLQATSGSNTSVAAHPKYTTAGSYADMAAWWAADATATGNANLNRIYTTVKVEEGQDMTITFKQVNNNEWIVYGQFKLEKLTDAEGENAQALEAAYNGKTGLDIASGRFKQRFESWEKPAPAANSEKLTQTITGLPNGKYNVTINGSASTTGSRDGFAIVTGDENTVFFANDQTVYVPVKDRTNVGNDEFGDYTVEGALVTDGTLKIGYRNIVAGANWFTASVKSIEYLGVDLSDYEVPFNTAVANAKAVNQEAKMNADVLAALQTAISNNDVDFSTFTKAADVETAINALNTATGNANTSIGIYAAVTAKYNTLDAAGKAAFETTTNGAKYVANTLVNEDCVADFATAAKAQTTEGADMTLAIVNPTVDGQTGWTISMPKGGNGPLLDGTAFEYWAGSANPRAEGSFDYYQVIDGLDPGVYEVSAEMSNSLNGEAGATFTESCGVYGNNTIAYVTTEGDARNKYTATVTVTNGTLRLGVKSDKTMGARWFTADNFTLTFVSAISLDDYRNNVATLLTQANAITGKQQTSLATALADAISATEGYESETDVETLNSMIDGLTEAIANSNASVAAYAALNSALNDIYVDRSAAFGTEFTYRAEAVSMYTEATANTAEVQDKANGIQLAYRNYVKAIAENYPTVEGVKDARDADAWVFTTEAKNNGNLNNTVNNDIAANAMRENWRANGLVNGDMKQTVSVPNGKYFLRMVSFTRNSPNANDYIYIKSGSAEETSVTFGDPVKPNGFVNITNPIEVTNGQVEIGLHIGSGADWAAIGGVVLYAVTEDVTRTTATDKYGTICLPYAATATGATVYSAAINGNEVVLTEVGTDLEAGVPYIYQATADAQTFSYASGNIVAAPAAAEALVGVFTDTSAPVGSYVMQTLDGKQQFYIVAEGKQPTVGANKAYLSVPTSSAKAFSIGFGDDNATAVDAVNALINGNAEIYSIGGVKLQKLQKGINIVNGVPVMVK